MKLLLGIGIVSIVLIGCSSSSKEYRDFYKKYNSNTRTYCKDGFKMRETFLSPEAKAPQVYLINSQECK